MICILTMGSIDRQVAHGVVDFFKSTLQQQIALSHDPSYPLYAFEPRRNQYYARRILEKLLLNMPGNCEKIICVTDVDLCTPILTYVYGEAQLNGSVAVVSVNRLKQEFYHFPRNDGLLIERLIKECLHELGHLYGLVHCNDTQCAMFFSSSILNIDDKQKRYCVNCNDYFEAQKMKGGS